MSRLTSQKLEQAGRLLEASDLDLWITFVRETAEGADPVLPLIIEGGLTWQSALIVSPGGKRVAIVGSFDADPMRATGEWHEIIPYVEGIRDVFLQTLERLIPGSDRRARIGINWSLDDPKADGITHGMALVLDAIVKGTRFEGSFVSAETIVQALRCRKTPDEIERIRRAVRTTEDLLRDVPSFARPGRTEREVFDDVQGRVRDRGLGLSWDARNDPIVNSGPDSMIGHGIPSETIRIAPGHLFHIDFGILEDGYGSDLQRTWIVREPGARGIPEDVTRAFHAVHGAISAGARALRPGTEGWRVDAAARAFLVSAGYPEFEHALGHQVGRMAHDGGALLGPRWEKYGRMPMLPVEEDQVFTLELGVIVDGRGYLGIEEMVLVTENGCEWISARQDEIMVLD